MLVAGIWDSLNAKALTMVAWRLAEDNSPMPDTYRCLGFSRLAFGISKYVPCWFHKDPRCQYCSEGCKGQPRIGFRKERSGLRFQVRFRDCLSTARVVYMLSATPQLCQIVGIQRRSCPGS